MSGEATGWGDLADRRRLQLAAPDMLAALECIADALSPPRNAEEAEAIAAALAAIAKAKGEA